MDPMGPKQTRGFKLGSFLPEKKNLICIVGGWTNPNLKNMFVKNRGDIFPKFSGCKVQNSKKSLSWNPPPFSHLVISKGRRGALQGNTWNLPRESHGSPLQAVGIPAVCRRFFGRKSSAGLPGVSLPPLVRVKAALFEPKCKGVCDLHWISKWLFQMVVSKLGCFLKWWYP